MHVHLPKPLHGWRAFLGEVGIIVLGVLIALSAEQIVANFRAKAQLRDAKDAMAVELRDDDLPQAFARAAVNDCFVGQLDAIENAIVTGLDRDKVFTLTHSYGPVFRTWDDQAWKAALTSQPFIDAGAKEMIRWSTPYAVIPVLTQQASDEQAELAQLRAKVSGDGPLPQQERNRLFQVISVLRRDNARMTGGSRAFMNFASQIGLKLTEKEETSIIAEARQKYGSCAKPVSLAGFDLSRQYTDLDAPPAP